MGAKTTSPAAMRLTFLPSFALPSHLRPSTPPRHTRIWRVVWCFPRSEGMRVKGVSTTFGVWSRWWDRSSTMLSWFGEGAGVIVGGRRTPNLL